MSKIKSGKKQILLFRALKDAETAEARKLVYQLEHSVDKTKESETVQTKDGAVNLSGSHTEEITFSSNWAVEDAEDTLGMLEDTFDNDEVLEMWEVDLDSPETAPGTYNGKYRQGMLNDFSYSAGAEDAVEVEMTFVTDYKAQKGVITLSEAQEAAVQYAFRDVDIVVPGP